MERLEGISVAKLLSDHGNLDSLLAEIAVEETDDLLRGTGNAVGLGHKDFALRSNKISVDALLARAGANTRRGDNVHEVEMLVTMSRERRSIGKSVRNLDGALAGFTVNGADVTVGDVQGIVVVGNGDGVGLDGGDSGIRHFDSFSLLVVSR